MSKTIAKEATICVVGLGYVGLPLAVAFDDQEFPVVGYDVDPERVEQLESGQDPTGDVGHERVEGATAEFTTDGALIAESDYVIIAVPTPVDDLKNPNLQYVEAAGETVGEHIMEGTTVVLESTVYPGATREILAPAIEDASGLEAEDDFQLAYSPERMVPGDDEHDLENVVKIVGADDPEVLEDVASLYESVVDAGIHRAPEIEIAEAAKCIENIQRDLNIALVNELAITCDALGLDTAEVLEAAGTKWNWHDYHPGLVGGHCIPVDPFFMIYESERQGFSPKLIEQAREVNEYMPEHVAELTLHGLNDCGKVLQDATVLVLGLAYKPGVGDVRTSAVDGVIEELENFDVEVLGCDPHADPEAVRKEFGVEPLQRPRFEDVDAVVLATPHEQFLDLDYRRAAELMADTPLVVDVSGSLDDQLSESREIEYRRV